MIKYIICLLLLTSFKLEAQKKTSSKSQIKQDEVVPYTVIFKLTPASKNCLNDNSKGNHALKKIFTDIKMTSVEKFSKTARSPNGRKGQCGKDMVDLSLIYILKYDGTQKVQEVARKLKQTGLVEYAEPKFVERIFVIPNDPEAQPATGKQWALETMRAYEAWDIEKGDTNIVIGIIDTDINILNPDLVNKIQHNYGDRIDGIDNDIDGYVDNFSGWDLGNNDNDVKAKMVTVNGQELNGNGHGTMVAGCAAAETNNGIGVAGTGFGVRYLPLKCMRDESARGGGISMGYDGIEYAADHGCKVINTSWGGGNSYSAFAQDIINYAAINMDVVVVAAAGNDSIEQSFYPASYDNVLSVAATDRQYSASRNRYIDIKAGFGTYSRDVDISAPGKDIYTTYIDGYGFNTGSSFSAPYVAGAAALVRSKFKNLNALQVIEQLRTTADIIDTLSENLLFKEKFGRGRLNMLRALTDTLSPSVRLLSENFPDNIKTQALPGDTIRLTCSFQNLLRATTNLSIAISTTSPFVKLIDSTFIVGRLNTLATTANSSKPFLFVVSTAVPTDYEVEFRLAFNDGTYIDYQYFKGTINPSFLSIDTNLVALTVSSRGRLGFNDPDNQQGIGFVYDGNNLLFEGGLMVSTSPDKVADCVRGNPQGEIDFDFVSTQSARYIPSLMADQQTSSAMIDTAAPKIGLQITQNSYAWRAAPDNKYVMLTYAIKNVSEATFDSLYAGIYADWDIEESGLNKAGWNAATKLGYVHNTQDLFAGVALLSPLRPSCFSLDHSSAVTGNNINPNDGFTSAEKHATLSGGIKRPVAGGTAGGDVSQVVAASMYAVAPGETRYVTFAMIGGNSLQDMIASATAANQKFNSLPGVTAVESNLIDNMIKAGPNPFSNHLAISTTNLLLREVEIFNGFGQKLGTYVSEESQININMALHPAGIYFIKINTTQGTTIKRFVKL